MNLLARILAPFKDRRASDEGAKDDRRINIGARTKAASARVDSAIDELTQTLRINREEFLAEIREVVNFQSYADICQYRYSPKDSLMVLCKHKGHDAHATGVAACKEGLCPRLREAAKK